MFEALEKLAGDFMSGKKKKKKGGMKKTTITIASNDTEEKRPSIAEQINWAGHYPDKKKKKKGRSYGGRYE